ncbi:MAG: DUF3833 domain-containing protein [Rhodospirillaceae bacterium]
MLRKLLITLLLTSILPGCSGMTPRDFAQSGPKLVIEEYFAGQTKAWGIFEDRFGTLRRQFTVLIDGKWDGKTLTLDERFDYKDGEKDRRVWRITKKDKDTYEGKAADVLGVATGKASGNALNWTYEMDLKIGDGTLRVAFNDWMFLQSDGVLINRARVSKLGIDIGTVTLFFKKPEKVEAKM